MKNSRLEEKNGLREGDRVRLAHIGDYRCEEIDELGRRKIEGVVYQIYELFVVIKMKCGTRQAVLWDDFSKWRVL